MLWHCGHNTLITLIRTVKYYVSAVWYGIFQPRPKTGLQGVVVSPGGVATTALMEHLQKFLPINCAHDKDGLKHMMAPAWAAALPCLYLTGSEDEIVASLRRRGYITIQIAKLGGLAGLFVRGRLQDIILKKLIRRQKANWAAKPNCLVIGYDELWGAADEIARHFKITDERFFADFPQRRDRSSRSPATSILPQPGRR
jgi:hypothetical protein